MSEADGSQTANQGQGGVAGSTPPQGPNPQGNQATQQTKGDGYEPATAADAQDPNNSRFMTKEGFKGFLDHHRRQTKEDLASVTKGIEKTLSDKFAAEIAKSLDQQSTAASAGTRKGKGAGDGAESSDLEMTSLKRQLEDANRSMTEIRAQLDKERSDSREKDKKSRILDALRRHDCTRPEVAYAVVKDQLQLGEDSQTVFAVVKDEWGTDQKVPLDDFVRGEIRDKLVPELFKGANRGGSPAGGDTAGATSGRWKFTREQLQDPEFYRKHRDEISVALTRGEVKGMEGPPPART